MAKICDYCEGTRTQYVRTTENVFGYPMTIYKCSDCGSKTHSVRIPNLKSVNILDLVK